VSPNEIPWELVLSVVVVLAAVQSVFGVGLLVFGTPTLLMFGVDFTTILTYLLPCSLTISALQVGTSGGLTLEPVRRSFLKFAAPAVVVGTIVTLNFGSPARISLLVGVLLVVTALLRILPSGQRALDKYVANRLRGLFVTLGLVHGLSNLGGGLLTGIMGSLFDDKVEVRRHIAFCYGLMATLQLGVVLLSGATVQPVLMIGLAAAAGTVFLITDRFVFRQVTGVAYQHALTGLLATFGLILVTR
jgi:uncharacterized protein